MMSNSNLPYSWECRIDFLVDDVEGVYNTDAKQAKLNYIAKNIHIWHFLRTLQLCEKFLQRKTDWQIDFIIKNLELLRLVLKYFWKCSKLQIFASYNNELNHVKDFKWIFHIKVKVKLICIKDYLLHCCCWVFSYFLTLMDTSETKIWWRCYPTKEIPRTFKIFLSKREGFKKKW